MTWGGMNNQFIINNFLNHSALLNGVLIPATSIESAISNYVQILFVNNDYSEWPLTFMGSCLTIFFRDRYFAICCRHQLKVLQGRPYQDIGILDKDGGIHCTSAGIRYFEDANDNELHELVLLDFTEPCRDRPIMRNRFIHLDAGQPEVKREQIIGLIASGYPARLQQYDSERRHFNSVIRNILCQPAPKVGQTDDPTLHCVLPNSPIDFDPDGMSGGTVFMLYERNGCFHIGLAGIITRANASNFYILRIDSIMHFIDAFILGLIRSES